MIYREKFHYSVLLIKTSNISMCNYIFLKTHKYIYQYLPFYFYWKKYSKKLSLYLYLNNFKSR